jgi:N-acetylglutamate synthase/N-acetylornithine aminotransferase
LTENEKVKILTLSGEEHFYYITVDKETSTNEVMKIIDDVKQLVRK